jgi:outer membrane receptor for ferrienterochelin and colicins
MKYLNIFSILYIFLILNNVSAQDQSDANVFGDVKANGEHLPFISVFIEGTTIGTATDVTGHFKLVDLPTGKHTIVARSIGYRTLKQEVEVFENDTKELNFELDEDVLELEGVVVTADRNEMNRSEAPVVINAITPKLFEKTSAVCIAEGLDFTPGLRMECNCQNCGFSQVRMNGLEGPYSQILINSRPVFSGLAGVYGLELIPSSMVQRIEVVRGGGSALFGGNAIAGTVNVITKEPSYNAFTISDNIGAIGIRGHDKTEPAVDHTVNVNGTLMTDDAKSGIFIYGMLRDRDSYDENSDDFTEIVELKNTTLGFSAYHKTGDRSKLSLDLYKINEFRRGGNKLDYLPHEADIAEQTNHDILGSSLSFDLFTNQTTFNKLSLYVSAQKVDRESYYGAQQDENAYGVTNDLTTSIGGQYTMNIENLGFAPATLVIGIDDNTNFLEDTKLGVNGVPNNVVADQYVNTIGSFFQNEWDLGFGKIAFGIRYDNYSIKDLDSENEDINGNVVAPRLNLKFDITSQLHYRISYAKGYRAPQIFDEDLHIEASGSRVILHDNSPDLTQESSHSLTSSFNYISTIGSVQSELLVEGFYTRLINPFANELSQLDKNGTYLYTRINADNEAHVAGINLELNTAFSNNISMQLGYTLQENKYDEAQYWGDSEVYPEHKSEHFMRTPNQYGYATVDWHVTRKFEISLNSTYTGRMYVPHFGLDPNTTELEELAAIENEDVIAGERLEKSESFLHMGFRFAYDFKLSEATKIQVSCGVKNLFNQMQAKHDSGKYRDAGYIYGPCEPRTMTIGVKLGNF